MQIIYDNDDKYNNHCAKTKEKSSSCNSFISAYDIKLLQPIDKKVTSHQGDNYDDHLGRHVKKSEGKFIMLAKTYYK